jgi:hypothetical protein
MFFALIITSMWVFLQNPFNTQDKPSNEIWAIQSFVLSGYQDLQIHEDSEH